MRPVERRSRETIETVGSCGIYESTVLLDQWVLRDLWRQRSELACLQPFLLDRWVLRLMTRKTRKVSKNALSFL
jgi:hypothetical protein